VLNKQINASQTTLRAIASEPRLKILHWLKDPAANFLPQRDGDFELDGVCADRIREKLGVSAPTISRHLTLMVDAQLLIATPKRGWTFYKRNEANIRKFAISLIDQL
jgi:DNA-binding transcriptional ArsR family regulator